MKGNLFIRQVDYLYRGGFAFWLRGLADQCFLHGRFECRIISYRLAMLALAFPLISFVIGVQHMKSRHKMVHNVILLLTEPY